jgi:type IX secretion system PorP/SprF family membrane protein
MLSFGLVGVAHSQIDPLYNQYLFNQSMINPAYTGFNNVFSATAISRGQWIGLDGAPFTNTLNVSTSLVGNKVGVGLLLIKDQFGVNNNTEFHMMYSYKLELTTSMTMSFGIQIGQMSYNHDFTTLNQDQGLLDPDIVNQADFKKTNFGSGIFLSDDNYYFGVSIPRMLDIDVINNNGDNVTRYNKHTYLSGGYFFNDFSTVGFKPSFLLKFVEGKLSSIDLNAHVLINEAIWVGATTRNFESFGVNGQLFIGDQLRLGYAFELPLNSLGKTAFSTHELMVSYDLELLNVHNISKRYF